MAIRSRTLEEGLGAEADDTFEECNERREELLVRLRSVELTPMPEKFAAPPTVETHRECSHV